MNAPVFFAALTDFTRARRIVAWLLVIVALFGVASVWDRLSTGFPPEESYSQLAEMLAFRVLALASAIFSTAVISGEVEQKTIVYLLTRAVPRWQILLSRSLASLLVVFVIGAISLLVCSAASYHGRLFSNSLLWRDMITIAIGTVAYGSLFILLSLLINKAMTACLLFAFGWETSMPNLPGDMYRLSIFSHLKAISNHPESPQRGALDLLAGQLGGSDLTAAQSWPVLIVASLAFSLIATFWFSRFEYLPREDT